MTLLPSVSSLLGIIHSSNQQLLLIYVLSATVLILFVLLLIIFANSRSSRLNWYQQNLLDLSSTNTQYMHRRAFTRCDTQDDREMVSSYELIRRKQSRIVRIDGAPCPLAALDQPDSRSIARRPLSDPPPKPIDLTDSFTIPRVNKSRDSMFNNPHSSQFDRGLYQCTTTMPDSESCYDDTSISGTGSIKLSLSIDANLGLLTVNLQQAIDVPSKRQDGAPNPYFRVALDIPDSGEAKSEQQTQIYKNTPSPTINEEFYFQTPSLASAVGACRLEVMVYDYDQFSVDECVGYCWLTLGRVSISTDKECPTVFWAEVLPFDENGGKGFGEVLFSLTYLSKAQRLTMNVFKARNLLVRSSDHGGAFSIRVSLLDNAERRLKRKKTSSKKNAKNAQFNESLTFSVPKNSLCDSILEIEAIHEYGTFGMGTEVLGKMELPLHKCKELWRAIIREEKSQARWYALEEP
ncbi:hypothetical protein PFISCL1PPCAC_24746 [Pristionchus fissidentatus]|uniref:C2 domain-containing protein n=1 Tax=Pristionchus fissidentatus TaxID=1538716 RepID=A0AAV5WRW5_9BILA|nr:hypothetical protein PFISCL1PPCAC_24746 [Pristionchus fissidentatus]